jgi:hypothetical protein
VQTHAPVAVKPAASRKEEFKNPSQEHEDTTKNRGSSAEGKKVNRSATLNQTQHHNKSTPEEFVHLSVCRVFICQEMQCHDMKHITTSVVINALVSFDYSHSLRSIT